jgi:hypothetical protein
MRDLEVFDVCHKRYRHLSEWLEGRVPGSGGRAAASTGYRWRPERGRAEDYKADFAMAGRRALARPTWERRQRLFQIYFLERAEYKAAPKLLGVPRSTFDWWCWEIKKVVGRELSRAGIFPPGKYFRARG